MQSALSCKGKFCEADLGACVFCPNSLKSVSYENTTNEIRIAAGRGVSRDTDRGDDCLLSDRQKILDAAGV